MSKTSVKSFSGVVYYEHFFVYCDALDFCFDLFIVNIKQISRLDLFFLLSALDRC